MTIKRLRKIKEKLASGYFNGKDYKYLYLPDYVVKQKLDEIVETMNLVIEYLDKANLHNWTKPHRIEELVVVDPEIPVNEDGHDEACNSGIGLECDCWRDEGIRKQSSEAIAKMKK